MANITITNLDSLDASHLEDIRKIAESNYNAVYSSFLSSEQIAYDLHREYSNESILRQVKQEGHQFLLLQEDEQVIGFASYCLIDQELGRAKLNKIYISPAHHRKGLGETLLSHIQQALKKDCYKSLELLVNKNSPSVKFYEKMGFSYLELANYTIGNGFSREDFLMRANLN